MFRRSRQRRWLRWPRSLRWPQITALGLALVFSAGVLAAREVAVRRRSPRGAARLPVTGGSVLIDYGRPALAGRPGFGGLAPWEEIWRFGDDEATRLETPIALRLGALRLDPGAYALFLLPRLQPTENFELVVHAEANRWGSYQRDPALDVGRVRLRAARLERPLERLSIVWEPTEEGRGRLWIGWEDRVLWTDFEAD